MSEELTELPNSWEWVKLGDIAMPSDKKVEPTEIQSIPYIGLEHIEKDTGNLLGYGNSKDVKSTKSKFYSGDLLYGKLRPYLNKVHVVNFEGVCSTDILVFSKSSYISNEFLKYRFLNKDFVSYASQNVNGVQHPRINFPTLADFSLALPPLNEQKRIVAKIEELNDRTQKAKEALDSIPQLCDRFRQSILDAAFRGDLTADWREQNPDVEPASMLLQRIRVKNQQTHKRKSNATPSSIALEMNNITSIPNTWQWISFGELITSIRSGSTAVPQDDVSSYPILRSSSVRPGSVDLTDIRYLTKSQSENEDNFLNDGDLLFTRLSGSIEYVANCALVRDLANRRIQYPDRLFRVKLVDKEFSNYSELWFATPLLRSLITNHTKSTAGHQRISMTAITEAPIPLPPLVEQQKIVEIVRSFLEVITNIEQQYQQAKGKLDHLNQSILAKAFRGELVPQDPDDEPASVLLERIRAERDKLNNSKPKSDRTSKRKRKTVEGQGFLPGFE